MKKISCSLLILSYRIFVTKVHIFYDGFMNFTIFCKKFFHTDLCVYFACKLCYDLFRIEKE